MLELGQRREERNQEVATGKQAGYGGGRQAKDHANLYPVGVQLPAFSQGRRKFRP